MKFVTKAVLLCLALPCSSWAVAAVCSSGQKAANQINALILIDQIPSNAVLKNMNMQFESDDGFMRGTGTFSFDHCGGLLQADFAHERSDKSLRGILATTFTLHVSRRVYGWDTNIALRNSLTETLTQKNTLFVDSHIKGIYLVNPRGIIERSGDITEGVYGTLPLTSRAMTHYRHTSDGHLISIKRISSLKSDQSFTQFGYNNASQLIGTQSASRKTEYSYDKTGSLAEESSIQTFSTIEKTVTRCNEWDMYDQCTKAFEHVTVIIPGIAGGKDKIEEHDVNVESTFTYWD
ncbi:hypothetical protein [Pantoea sp. GM01]|uniref:hypothetical protein n=1 Tax=Pantoea sp. GM01 TaxID=1144320 RepID=UPI000270E8F8|nr:hypothetical protein [Pantoea sp. GM01]EJL93131.1 hypothetical protein PMI17_00400 [Pantoea sp. GM01]